MLKWPDIPAEVIVVDTAMPQRMASCSTHPSEKRTAGIFLVRTPTCPSSKRRSGSALQATCSKQGSADSRESHSIRLSRRHIRHAVVGRRCDLHLFHELAARLSTVTLTSRQRDVPAVAGGGQDDEIGALLNISARTSESHKYEMMRQLGLEPLRN
jgi:DNA-binding NarL/FixJ family response regulator